MMDEFEQYDKGQLLRNRYLKVGDISEGSYGLVSVAKDTQHHNKLVAVKFIYPVDYKKKQQKTDSHGGSRPNSSPAKLRSPLIVNETEDGVTHYRQSVFKNLLNEAEKEIKIHKILGDHPNISKLYDHFDTYLILEFCSRGDLYEAIHNGNGPATTQDIKDVFQQIINALEFCHSHQVYHRDLKPENILISQDWSIKLCDWGLSTTEKIITNKDEFDIGSERYMAPELFDNNVDSYDSSKIDIWSLGIILLTLVFHKNPFQVANYSDKRFIQFVNNREALFDIFSTMSGDLFSILRYSLTIDPNNRNLTSISQELKLLRYFTIDEEYWASDYEEEEEDIEDEEEDDVEEYGSFDSDEKLAISPRKKLPKIEQFKMETEPITPSISIITDENEAGKVLSSTPPTIEDIPHNHRADALLSSSTNLKPIPIGGSGYKFVRNTRKPLNLASYNQNSNINRFQSYNNNNKFNREEFYTPKSIFNHYLDKYGEQKFGKSREYDRNSPFDKKPKRRTWKKNYKKKYKPINGNSNSYQQHYHQYGHQHTRSQDYTNDSHNHINVNRRKSRSYSTSKLKHPILQPPAPSPSSALPIKDSALSSSGKYVPPYLRSPTYQRSPVVEPLVEEMDHLSLSNVGDDDEVFHLEGDFEARSKQGSGRHHQPHHNGYGSDYNNRRNSRYEYPEKGYNNIHPGRRNSVAVATRKAVFGGNCNIDSSSMLSSSANSTGKYIPPFKRGTISTTTAPGTGKRISPPPPDKKEISKDIRHDLIPNHVSLIQPEWISSYRKDWSDYDD
ncbi:Serine/threonine-protein kinase KSP1 [Spathaspora sp. JA1]|nr:Serine/threonine-protein kinase KSP1 [Spathaspora sp. JA1]